MLSEKKRFWIYQKFNQKFLVLNTVFLIQTFYTGYILQLFCDIQKENISVLSLLLRILRLQLNKFSDLHMALPCDLLLVYENRYYVLLNIYICITVVFATRLDTRLLRQHSMICFSQQLQAPRKYILILQYWLWFEEGLIYKQSFVKVSIQVH